MNFAPHDFWQDLYPADTLPEGVLRGGHGYAAALPDGRRIVLPIRVLPGGFDRAVASLIVNQASFAVLDALADAVAGALRPHRPEQIVAVPTLGLPLAEAVARRLDHSRKVPLGTSRKFWYDDNLSEPLKSITTPDQAKRIYLDPRMLPLLRGRRIAVVDDVISTGASMASVLRLLEKAGLTPVAIGAAMLQGTLWRERLVAQADKITGAISTPILTRIGSEWAAEGTTISAQASSNF
jgi:adenine/guanine phosphoribosyltransferase-like PRPP-binding protein